MHRPEHLDDGTAGVANAGEREDQMGQGRRPPMDRATRAMLALVIGMGALILAGTTVVIATVIHRTFETGHTTPRRLASQPTAPAPASAPAPNLSLGVPAGSRIVSVTASGGRLALLITGGGPDEVVLIDPTDGSKIATLRAIP